MIDQDILRFQHELGDFLGDCDVEFPGDDIFYMLLGRETPVTLDELISDAFRNMDPELRQVYIQEHGKHYKLTLIRMGIAELQSLAVPILTTEDGKYRMGGSITDVWEMIESLEKDIKKLNSHLNMAHMNLGRLMEAHKDIDG